MLVQLNKLERFVLSQNQCASDGKFHVDGLEPGTYTVLAVMMPKGGMDPAAARIDSALVKLGKAESLSLELDVR